MKTWTMSNPEVVVYKPSGVIIKEGNRHIKVFYRELPALIEALKRANSEHQMRQNGQE